ncbi:hypothetical protein ACQP25_23155 [Microtetraspora malaysiensis]|uniref:HEAT repeat domain-containing protein n=1 Tax=Microtetraspora malaysiensis TaxID=161358 RepID=UPI003D8D754B
MLTTDDRSFAVLLHAYGKATDTPGHLTALLDGDESARRAALDHLNSAVIHQGTPWTATASAALAVGQILRDPSIADPDTAWLRRDLLRWLAEVGEAAAAPYPGDLAADAAPGGRDVRSEIARIAAASSDEDVYDDILEDPQREHAMWAMILLDCRQAASRLADVVEDCLADADPRVRASAACAATRLVRAAGLVATVPSPRPRLVVRLTQLARTADAAERAALVLALGDLGAAPREFLEDPHPGVRACAALAPALAGNPAAVNMIMDALQDPEAADRWFPDGLPQIVGRFRGTLLDAALERVTGFTELLPVALAFARLTDGFEWILLLLKAFPEPPVELDDAQRAYLAALADNESLWSLSLGDIRRVFERIRLPYDRQACRALAHANDSRAWLRDHGIRLSTVRGEWLATAEKIVADHGGAESAESTESDGLGLAKALLRLAGAHAASGHPERAVAAAAEAVRISLRLTPSDAHLIRALTEYGRYLGEAGRSGDASAAAERAIAVHAQMSQPVPADFDLAQALTGLGTLAADLGRGDNALTVTVSAVEVHRRLDNPVYLSPALADLSRRLWEAGRGDDALTAADEAVRTLREVAETNRFARADALKYLCEMLSDLGRWLNPVDALTPVEEAVAAFHEYVADRRAAAQASLTEEPDLADALTGLGLCLTRLGQVEQAVDAAAEAVRTHRRLADDLPIVFQPGLTRALTALAASQYALGQHEHALAAAREATDLCMAWARPSSGFFTVRRRQDLDLLADVFDDLGRGEDADRIRRHITRV